MVITLAVFAAIQFITPLWIRPSEPLPDQPHGRHHYRHASERHTKFSLKMTVHATVPGQPGAWILSTGILNPTGQPVSTVPAFCDSAVPALNAHGQAGQVGQASALTNCLARHGMRVAESFQPASHYWPLQWSETGMFLALALALAGYCFWRLNRRRT